MPEGREGIVPPQEQKKSSEKNKQYEDLGEYQELVLDQPVYKREVYAEVIRALVKGGKDDGDRLVALGVELRHRNREYRYKETPEKKLSPEQKEQLMSTLKDRFEANMNRHEGIEWAQVEAKLKEASPEKLWSLNEMERTGGEPDVVEFLEETGEYEFWDCAKYIPESKRERICYDSNHEYLVNIRFNQYSGRTTRGNALSEAKKMGLGGILNEDQYRRQRKLNNYEGNGHAWIDTPQEIRKQGKVLYAFTDDGEVKIRFSNLESNPSTTYANFFGWMRI